jgi:hypothetical protein
MVEFLPKECIECRHVWTAIAVKQEGKRLQALCEKRKTLFMEGKKCNKRSKA